MQVRPAKMDRNFGNGGGDGESYWGGDGAGDNWFKFTINQ